MKITVNRPISFNAMFLDVSANVRYFEDCTLNGKRDDPDAPIPGRQGDTWKIVINIETGKIVDWPKGVELSTHFKVCDAGHYQLLSDLGVVITNLENTYVPSCLSPIDPGYGDYINVNIDADGKIAGWNFDVEDWVQSYHESEY